jgi:uncharacterized protein
MSDEATATEDIDKSFIEYVVRLIVEKPDAVVVERTVDEMGVLLTLKVDKDDMGRVVGKDGKTAKALRTLLRTIGSRRDQRVNLKILEPEGSDRAEAPSEGGSVLDEDPLATGFEGMTIED